MDDPMRPAIAASCSNLTVHKHALCPKPRELNERGIGDTERASWVLAKHRTQGTGIPPYVRLKASVIPSLCAVQMQKSLLRSSPSLPISMLVNSNLKVALDSSLCGMA